MHDKQRRCLLTKAILFFSTEKRVSAVRNEEYAFIILSHVSGSKRRSPQMKKVAKGFLCYLISHFSLARPRSGMPRDALSPDVALKTQFCLLLCLCTA